MAEYYDRNTYEPIPDPPSQDEIIQDQDAYNKRVWKDAAEHPGDGKRNVRANERVKQITRVIPSDKDVAEFYRGFNFGKREAYSELFGEGSRYKVEFESNKVVIEIPREVFDSLRQEAERTA